MITRQLFFNLHCQSNTIARNLRTRIGPKLNFDGPKVWVGTDFARGMDEAILNNIWNELMRLHGQGGFVFGMARRLVYLPGVTIISPGGVALKEFGFHIIAHDNTANHSYPGRL